MSNYSMIRGTLPPVWLAFIGSTVLLYDLPSNDPVWGDLFATMRKWNAPLLPFITLALLTLFLGFPSKKEVVAALVEGVAGRVAIAILAATSILFVIALQLHIYSLSVLMIFLLAREISDDSCFHRNHFGAMGLVAAGRQAAY